MKLFFNVMLFSLVLFATTSFAQDKENSQFNTDRAKELVAFCYMCHGENGKSDGEYMATLQGQNKEYIINTMNDFKSGKRYSTMMGIVSTGYDADQIELIAEHFSSKKWVKTSLSHDASLASKGKMLAEENCMACHNMEQANYVPKIEGQHAAILYRSLLQFKQGQRNGENAAEMELIKDLSDEQLKILAEYYASMK